MGQHVHSAGRKRCKFLFYRDTEALLHKSVPGSRCAGSSGGVSLTKHNSAPLQGRWFRDSGCFVPSGEQGWRIFISSGRAKLSSCRLLAIGWVWKLSAVFQGARHAAGRCSGEGQWHPAWLSLSPLAGLLSFRLAHECGHTACKCLIVQSPLLCGT